MRLPGLPSLVYAFYLLAFMPWMAIRTRRRLAAARGVAAHGAPDAAAAPPKPASTRTQIFASTLFSLGMLALLTWFTGSSFGYAGFVVPVVGVRAIAAGAAAFLASIGLMLLNRVVRSPEERRAMAVYRLMPRTRTEWTLYVATAIAAGIAEEAAYRGVLMAVLSYSLGSAWAAAAVCATAFAVSHALQGWKSGVVIFGIALLMHGLVWFTGTLVVAMVVHAVYDIVAGIVGAWRVRTGRVDG